VVKVIQRQTTYGAVILLSIIWYLCTTWWRPISVETCLKQNYIYLYQHS